eukprot:3941970-Rhodomonas_salina.2
MSGTDVTHAAVSAYVHAMSCPVLSERMVVQFELVVNSPPSGGSFTGIALRDDICSGVLT